MATASEIAAVAALSDVDAAAICYLAVSEGDVDRALIWAVEDLLRTERELAEVRRAVSHGYVRAGMAKASHAAS